MTRLCLRSPLLSRLLPGRIREDSLRKQSHDAASKTEIGGPKGSQGYSEWSPARWWVIKPWLRTLTQVPVRGKPYKLLMVVSLASLLLGASTKLEDLLLIWVVDISPTIPLVFFWLISFGALKQKWHLPSHENPQVVVSRGFSWGISTHALADWQISVLWHTCRL